MASPMPPTVPPQQPQRPEEDFIQPVSPNPSPAEKYGEGTSSLGYYAVAFGNEMLKSFGGYVDPKTGQWDWSVDRIKQAFEDDPIWTTIDYLSLVAGPVLRPLSGAAKVAGGYKKLAKGVASGKGLRRTMAAGHVAPASALGRGRIGVREAARLGTQLPSQSRVGRFFENPATTHLDDDYMKLVQEEAAITGVPLDPIEARGLGQMMARELAAETAAAERFTQDWTRDVGKLMDKDPDAATGITRMLFDERALSGDKAYVKGEIGETAAALFERQRSFREEVWQKAYNLNMFDRDVYEEGLRKHDLGMFEQYLGVQQKIKGPKGSIAPNFTGKAKRGFTKVLDPRLHMDKLMRASQQVATVDYAHRLAGSAIAKTGDEVVELMGRIMERGDKRLTKLYFGSEVPTEEIARTLARSNDAAAKRMGWKTIEDMFPDKRAPAFLENLPKEFRELYIDPAVQNDFLAIMEIGHKTPLFESATRALGINFQQVHGDILGTFRTGKTAYNPATHFRNLFGTIVFHHLAVGGMGVFKGGPMRGYRAIMEGGEEFAEGRVMGIIGSTFTDESRAMINKEYKGLMEAGGREITGLDWVGRLFGDNRLTRNIKKGAGKMERLYRSEDEMYKLDAYLRLRDKFKAAGLGIDEARAKARLEVDKFFPTFNTSSGATHLLKQMIPFGSFTAESARVWKNAMIEKPHLAFFWNHLTEQLTTAAAARLGLTMDEVEKAKSNIPGYTQGKKLLMMPVLGQNGRPEFLDLSFHIPLANIQEAAGAEETFFGMIGITPTSNPLLSFVAAGSTGVDPFSKRTIEPRFTERQLGVTIEGPRKRHIIGLAEHMAATMMPPLAPPGYSGVNLLELVRGQTHPTSGAELEANALRTIAANIFGMRTYEADTKTALFNVRQETRSEQDEMNVWWNRWEWGAANNDPALQRTAMKNIIQMRDAQSRDGWEYFRKSAAKRTPGEIALLQGISKRQAREVLRRQRQLGGRFTAEERRLRRGLRERARSR